MADQNFIPGDVRIGGNLLVQGNQTVSGSRLPLLPRSSLEQDTLAIFPVPFENFRVWDAYQTLLPGTSATDDLGLYGGTFATASQLIRTYDVKTVGATTLYARTRVIIPAEYDDGETIQFRIHCGMVTTVADTSCTIDLQAYEVDSEGGISADLITTSATTMNSLTFANKDFTVTSSGIVAGDILDVRVAIAVNDGASVGAVIAAIGAFNLLCDIRG